MIGFIYKITIHNMIYIGSTFDINRRIYEHTYYTNNIRKTNNLMLYKYIRDNGGWDMVKVKVRKTIDVNDKKELKEYEQHYIRKYDSCNPDIGLNIYMPTRTKQELKVDNPEKIKEQKRNHYHKYKQQILEKQKAHNQLPENKERVLQRHRDYYQKNKERLLLKEKERREQNKDIIKAKNAVKHNCDCGGQYTGGHRRRHEQTTKHIEWLHSQEQ